MVVNVFFALEDAVGLDHIEGIQRLAGLGLIDPGHHTEVSAASPLTGVAILVQNAGGNHRVVVVSEVTRYIVVEILTDLVFPVGQELDTGVADFTLVHLHGIQADGLGPAHGLVLDQVERALVVVVNGQGEAVAEEIHVNTTIKLLGGFPGQKLVHSLLGEPESTILGTGFHPVDSRLIPVAAAQVGALVVEADGTQVTYATPGSTELEEADGVGLGEERLAGNLPGTGHGREVTLVVTLGQAAGIVTAPGCGHKVAVVIAVGATGNESHVGIVTGVPVTLGVVVTRGNGTGEGDILESFGFILEVFTHEGEAAAPGTVGRSREESAHRVLAEGTVKGEGVFRAPLFVAAGDPLELVVQSGLTNLGTLGIEVLVQPLGVVVGELGIELETLHDVGNLKARGGPELGGVVVTGIGQQEAERVDGITVDIGKVAAALGNVGGILGHGTAVRTGVRTGSSIGFCTLRHVDSGKDGTAVSAAGVGTAAAHVTVGEVLRDLDVLVQLVLSVVADTQLFLERTHQDTGVVLIAEGQTALELVATIIEGEAMTLIESRAEDLIHPVGAGGSHPGVHVGIPAGRQGKAGVGIGDLAHLNLLLSVQRLGKIGSHIGTSHEIVLYMDALGALLGGYQDNAAGTGSGTVDSGRGSVLQNDDALDIVHGGDGSAGNAVYYPQHGVSVTGALATDNDLGRGIRRTAVGRDSHARDLALEHALRGGNRTGGQLFGVVHDTHRSGQVLLLGLGTVTEGNGFLKHFSIFHEDDVDVGATVHVHLLRGVAQAGDFENSVGRNGNGIITIQVRNGVGTTGEHYGTSDRSHSVTHGSTHCQILGLRREGYHQAHKCGGKTEQFLGNHSGWLKLMK